MKILLSVLLLLPALSFSAPIEIVWWHAMSGTLGERVEEMVKRYHSTQDKVRIKAVYRGNYTETLNAAIAAYRGKKQPHLVQVFEVGTLTMMNSKVIYPVEDLMKDYKYDVNWSNFLQPVLSYYKDSQNKLLSMPFNSSTPIMYYNKDMFKQAGVLKTPKTWGDVYLAAEKLVSNGAKCGLVTGWQSWVLLENFSAIHNLPFATKGNGFESMDTELAFANKDVIANIKKLQKGMKKKYFLYEGRRSDPARNAFVNGKCGIYFDSSSQLAGVEKIAKFDWATAALPYKKGTVPSNSIIGGATLWTFQGHSKEEYKGVADFLNYIASSANQIWWHRNTGYLPITKTAYQELKARGYYKKNPNQETAVLQLLRGSVKENTRGIRLGNFSQIREIINEEFEKIWAGKVDPEKGLETAQLRGNRVLKRFYKSAKRRQ